MKKSVAFVLAFIIAVCPILSFADELVSEIVSETNDSFIIKISLKSGPKIMVDGTEAQYDPKPYEENGRIFVPIRSILESLGFVVAYDEATETVYAIQLETEKLLIMQIGSNKYYYGGTHFEFDAAPHVKDGRTFTPIRIIYEMLGYEVSYDEATDTAIISSR